MMAEGEGKEASSWQPGKEIAHDPVDPVGGFDRPGLPVANIPSGHLW